MPLIGNKLGGKVAKVGGAIGKHLGAEAGARLGSAIGGYQGAKIGGRLGGQAGKFVGKTVAKQGTIAVNKGAEKVAGSMKKGGHVRKTGLYRLHKGEYVLTMKKVSSMQR